MFADGTPTAAAASPMRFRVSDSNDKQKMPTALGGHGKGRGKPIIIGFSEYCQSGELLPADGK
jgi:hypothetical protein